MSVNFRLFDVILTVEPPPRPPKFPGLHGGHQHSGRLEEAPWYWGNISKYVVNNGLFVDSVIISLWTTQSSLNSAVFFLKMTARAPFRAEAVVHYMNIVFISSAFTFKIIICDFETCTVFKVSSLLDKCQYMYCLYSGVRCAVLCPCDSDSTDLTLDHIGGAPCSWRSRCQLDNWCCHKSTQWCHCGDWYSPQLFNCSSEWRYFAPVAEQILQILKCVLHRLLQYHKHIAISFLFDVSRYGVIRLCVCQRGCKWTNDWHGRWHISCSRRCCG